MQHARRAASLDTTTLPISVYQHRYWLKWAQNPLGSSFNTSAVLKVPADFDREASKRSWEFVVNKHDIVHATFSEDGSTQFYSPFEIDDFFHEVRLPEAADRDSELTRLLNAPFDLTAGPLLRLYLVDHGSECYFVAVMHHIITDAAAADIVTADAAIAYEAYRRDPAGVEPEKYSYAACVDALHASITPQRQVAAREFWTDFLTSTPPTVAFPTKEGADPDDYSAQSIYLELDEETSARLRAFARENGTTLFIVLAALYGLLLARYADQDEVVISYPKNMRPVGHGHVAGCFVNLSLLKVAIGADTTFTSLVGELARQREEAKPHQFFQLSDIINERAAAGLDIEKSYFGVFFGATRLTSRPLPIGVPLEIPWSQEFDRDLRLIYDPFGDGAIKLRMDSRAARHDRAVVLRFVEDFKALAETLAVDERPLRETVSAGAAPA